MALLEATLTEVGTYLASLLDHASIHAGDPGTTGLNPVVGMARQPVTWTVDSDGDLSLNGPVDFFGGPANGSVRYVGLWTGLTGGTFRGSYPMYGDPSLTIAGEYHLNTLVINGTASG